MAGKPSTDGPFGSVRLPPPEEEVAVAETALRATARGRCRRDVEVRARVVAHAASAAAGVRRAASLPSGRPDSEATFSFKLSERAPGCSWRLIGSPR